MSISLTLNSNIKYKKYIIFQSHVVVICIVLLECLNKITFYFMK